MSGGHGLGRPVSKYIWCVSCEKPVRQSRKGGAWRRHEKSKRHLAAIGAPPVREGGEGIRG